MPNDLADWLRNKQGTPPLCLVSACLCGVLCRYDGRGSGHPAMEALLRSGLALTVCPERDAGLPVPRSPCERNTDKVKTREGDDLTTFFAYGARIALTLAREHNLSLAILKDKSPSCGSTFVYDGTFTGRLVAGEGVTASLLRAHGIVVASETNFLPHLLAL